MAALTIKVLLFFAAVVLATHGYQFPSSKSTWTPETSTTYDVTEESTDEPTKRFSRLQTRPTCSENGLHPDPMDCKTYIECYYGHSFVRSCPYGQHFSEETRQCDSPCVAKCDPAIACELKSPKSRKFPPMVRTVSDYRCTEDGLYRNPEDCSSYIHCSNGQSYVMPCVRGLHFNDATDRCEAPCDAQCDSSLTEECGWNEATTQADDSDDVCRRPPDSERCKARITRYYFDANDGVCKRFMYGGCQTNGNNFKTKKECYLKCLRRRTDFSTVSYKPLKISTLNDFTCIEDGNFPNPENCGTYVECSEGEASVMSCPGNLHFSQQNQRCEAPCDAHCDATLTDECGWKLWEFQIVREDFTCEQDGLFPGPANCSTYIQCSFGQGFIMACDKGLDFNQQTLTCETPCEARCNASLAKVCGWKDRTGYMLKQPVFDFSCLSNGLFENDADCGTFIQCTGGNAYLISCAVGKHFNPQTKKCESPCEAKCDPNIEEQCQANRAKQSSKRYPTRPQVEVETARKSAVKSSALGDFMCNDGVYPFFCKDGVCIDGVYPNPESCSSYIRCRNGRMTIERCPDGFDFSRTDLRCETPCNALCDRDDPYLAIICGLEWDLKAPRTPQYDFACTEDGLYQDFELCSSYVRCTNGQAYAESCTNGLHFNPDTSKCETPCEAHCDPAFAAVCGWVHPVSPSKKLLATEPSTDPSMIVADFECDQEAFYKYSSGECVRYIQCTDGVAYGQDCPEGLHFNERTQSCVSPCDAHCNQSLACECGWPECNSLIDTLKTTAEAVHCEAVLDSGPCFGSLQRYFYDQDSGRCRRFTYGGCGGNSNNFETEEECQQKCQRVLLGGFRCPTNSGMFGHYPDCLSYYECKRGVPTLKRCPSGTAFDHMMSKCVNEREVKCLYKCREPNTVYTHDQDPNSYIKCENGVSKLMKYPVMN